MPTAEEEKINPKSAADTYEAVTRLLINQRRDTKRFPLIYKENVNYGFCRNLFFLRKLGVFTSIIGALVALAAGWSKFSTGGEHLEAWVYAVINGFILCLWLFIVTKDWVKIPAFAYAERLLESSAEIETPKGTKRQKKIVEASATK